MGCPTVKKIIIAVGISLIVGFAAASWMEIAILSPGSQERGQLGVSLSAFDTAAPVEERIRALEQAVIQEQQFRQLLEDELFALRAEIEQGDEEFIDREEGFVEVSEARREEFRSRRAGESATQNQVDTLIEAGFAPDQAEWIVRREAEIQMEGLQARYDAMRMAEEQGFLGRRLSDDSALRSGLGETDYERYLQAKGRSTSAEINTVIPNSPAHNAGIQAGDVIVRYDGERVYSMMDMAGRIMQNEQEGNVVVDIERGGVPMQLVIPRGPLGLFGN